MRKQKSGAGTAGISRVLRQRKPELLLTAAALAIFALIWGAEALQRKPAEIYVPAGAVTVTANVTAAPAVTNPLPGYEAAPPGDTDPAQTAPSVSPAPQATTRKPPAPTAAPGPVIVNVNTAGPEELQRLPGIGPVKAKAIADYRAQHGMFLSPEELLNVKGIGPATLAKLRPYVVF